MCNLCCKVPDVFTEFECFYSLVFGRNRHIPRVEIGTENVRLDLVQMQSEFGEKRKR